MPILRIEHAVRDFADWQRAFDSDPVGRKPGRVRRYRILRPTDDPNYVLVDLEFDSRGEAEAFRRGLLALWGRVEGDLGLADPQARILDVVESVDYERTSTSRPS